jgi:soluble lytic murein transglycosylase
VGLACAIGLLFIGLVGLRAIFPLEFREQILAWSAVYDLEPAWVASVIRNESRFQPDAVSPAGAIGLMQIMPETGEWIAQQLQWPDYSTFMLTSAPENISLGTWYLRYLLDRFGTVDAALLAYNAGPTHAERWEGRVDLAFSETRQYIRRVHGSLPVYRAYFAVPWLINLIPSLHF